MDSTSPKIQAASGAAEPAFTVVIPLYNKRAWIRRAVESVLGQTVADFELLVVDDGSTDGSAAELQALADPRLRIIGQENQGVGAARNRGMREARAAWIAFLDADDAWLPDHLAELRALAQAFPEAGLLSCACVEVASGQPLPAAATDRASKARLVDYFSEAAQNIGRVNSTSVAVRRTAFERLGGFTGHRAGEDLEYWARIALDFPVALSERTTCLYFRDTAGVMKQLEAGAPRTVPPLRSLRDVSPSVALLADRAEQSPDLWSRPGLRAYVNSRLEGALKGALLRGDVANARRLAAMFVPPLTRRQLSIRTGVQAPAWSLRLGLAGYRWLASHARYARSGGAA